MTSQPSGAGADGQVRPDPAGEVVIMRSRTDSSLDKLRHELSTLPRPAAGSIEQLREMINHKDTTLDMALGAMLVAPGLIVALAALMCYSPGDPHRVDDDWLQTWLCLSIDSRRTATPTAVITSQMVTAQVSTLLGPYTLGKHGLNKVLRRVAHSEEIQPSPNPPRTSMARDDLPRPPFVQPQFTPPTGLTAPCVCRAVPCTCGSRSGAPLEVTGGHEGYTAGMPPPPPPQSTALQELTKAITAAFAGAGGRDKEDDAKGSFMQYVGTDKLEIDFTNTKVTTEGNSLELAARYRGLLDDSEEDAALKVLYAPTPEMYDMISEARLKDRQAVLRGRPGELFQDFGNFIHKSQLRRQAKATEAHKAKIAQQTGEAMHALQQHHKALRGQAWFGQIDDAAERDRLLEVYERHIVAIALGFVQDPKLRRSHIAAGFAAIPSISAAVTQAPKSTMATDPTGVSGASGVAPKGVLKRDVGSALPTAAAIMGTNLGTVKTTSCWTCGQMGHDCYECPLDFVKKTGTNMPGHDSTGTITDPHTYWKDGVAGSTISKEIASLWEKHSWSADFKLDVSTRLTALAIGKIAQGF